MLRFAIRIVGVTVVLLVASLAFLDEALISALILFTLSLAIVSTIAGTNRVNDDIEVVREA
jgi:hypothetical protein